jgi:hypothetical protein
MSPRDEQPLRFCAFVLDLWADPAARYRGALAAASGPSPALAGSAPTA